MSKLLNNRVAVITGAGQGIGYAIARAMANHGARIVVNDYGVGPTGAGRIRGSAEKAADEIRKEGGEAVFNDTSVETWQGGRDIIAAAIDNFGRLDILVNNAGIVLDKMIFNLTEEDWDKIVRVNLYGTFYCTRAATEVMKRNQYGRIINMSSGAGLGNTLGCSNYAAAKEGVVGFTRAVARDMAKYNVTCNAIRPLALTRHFDEKRKHAWIRQGIISELNEMEKSRPEDVAAFAAYLATENAAYISGRTFFVGGGMISLYSEPERTSPVYRGEDQWTLEQLAQILPKVFHP
jgi:NAD(P)-dependent dehydrogenase (short-subunit alcohol dehydrogenase family)